MLANLDPPRRRNKLGLCLKFIVNIFCEHFYEMCFIGIETITRRKCMLPLVCVLPVAMATGPVSQVGGGL